MDLHILLFVCVAFITHIPIVICNDNKIARLFGGVPASEGLGISPTEWPFYVAICERNLDKVRCGATLIHQEFVLTAAHCVEEVAKEALTLKFGILRINPAQCAMIETGQEHRQQIRRIKEIILHPHYKFPHDHSNDIALLRLARPIEYTPYIKKLQLPYYSYPIQVGEKCYAAGLGEVTHGGAHPRVLMKTPLIQSNRSACRAAYANIDHSTTCFRSGYTDGSLADTCRGDSGGPVICQRKGNRDYWVLGGVVSFGRACPQAEGGYANLDVLLHFIDRNIYPNDFISSVVIVKGTLNVSCPENWVRVPQDLDKNGNQYVYLCYKQSRSDTEAGITDIYVLSGTTADLQCKQGYHKLQDDISAQAAYVHLCYTYSAHHGEKIRDIIAMNDREMPNEGMEPLLSYIMMQECNGGTVNPTCTRRQFVDGGPQYGYYTALAYTKS